jgi:citrate/tricarballylate utilization protein
VLPSSNLIAEGERLMTICNACRYCEGFCAVFPAMERRLNFAEADIHYLANLCHNCAECYYACQYAPPHEFAVNVPKVFAEIRAQSYRKYAWPGFVRVNTWAALAIGIFVAALLAGTRSAGGANFYQVVSHTSMVGVFGVVTAFIIVVHLAGFLRFWRESGEGLREYFRPLVQMYATRDALSLKNLDSNGVGCTYPAEEHSQARRRFHHFTFYGFMLCFASTSIAAVYHSIFQWQAPYGYFSLPVVLGTVGGIGLLIGPAGLYSLKRRRDTAIVDTKQDNTDVAFLGLLFLTSFTGLLLLVLRTTPAMGALLRIHLGVVLGLFLTLPYGKFVHGIYRFAALVRSALETSRSPNQS